MAVCICTVLEANRVTDITAAIVALTDTNFLGAYQIGGYCYIVSKTP